MWSLNPVPLCKKPCSLRLLPLVAPTVETERDDVRDDLRREGRELREEGCSQALAVCLLVGFKATCVEIIQCVDPGSMARVVQF